MRRVEKIAQGMAEDVGSAPRSLVAPRWSIDCLPVHSRISLRAQIVKGGWEAGQPIRVAGSADAHRCIPILEAGEIIRREARILERTIHDVLAFFCLALLLVVGWRLLSL